MNKLYKYILPIFTLILLSCNRGVEEEKGSISIGKPDAESIVNPVSTMALSQEEIENLDYSLAIYSGDNIVAEYSSYYGTPRRIELNSGTYKVKVKSITKEYEAIFDYYTYAGEKEFEVKPSQNTIVNVTAPISSIKVAVELTDEIKSLLADYSITISNGRKGGGLTYLKNETRFGYFKPSKKLTYTLVGSNKQGDPVSFSGEVGGLNSADFLTLTFKKIAPEEDKNNFILRIGVDETVVYHSVNVNVPTENLDAPKLSATGITADNQTNMEIGTGKNAAINISSKEKIKNMIIDLGSENFLAMGFTSRQVNILTTKWPSDIAAIDKYGLKLTQIGTDKDENGNYNYTLPLTTFTKGMVLGTYNLRFFAGDEAYQEGQIKTPVYVYDRPVVIKAVSVSSLFDNRNGDKNANTLEAECVLEEMPAGTTFIYRDRGSSTAWNIIDPAKIKIDGLKYSITTLLPCNKSLEIKAALVANGAITSMSSNQINAYTKELPMPPNINFEQWNTSLGWDNPNTSARAYWDSGNNAAGGALTPGTKTLTTRETSLIVSGSAVRMESKEFFGIFAAGNLFTGEFKMTGTSADPSFAKFGRSFIGRPKYLEGYYHYPTGGDGQDKCDIYIMLTSRTCDGANLVPAEERIGFGELKNGHIMNGNTDTGATVDPGAKTDGYVKFRIPIVYNSNDTPAYIAIVASSSFEGAKFKGKVGSVMYLDELHFVYEYDEQ